ncbi:hypothetical protein ACWGB8_24060 [Kitasatospora sp. NPDC054939]
MAEVQPRPCYGCNGAGGTQKERITVETDPRGDQTPCTHSHWSPCGQCHGAGTVLR